MTGFVDHVRALVLPAAVGEATRPGESVAVVSAHAALGREWDFVVIAGLQEGLWPNVVPRGGGLATQQLVDVLDGIADGTSTRAPLVAGWRLGMPRAGLGGVSMETGTTGADATAASDRHAKSAARREPSPALIWRSPGTGTNHRSRQHSLLPCRR